MKLWYGTVIVIVCSASLWTVTNLLSHSVPVKPQPQPNGQSVVASSVVSSGSVRTVQPCEPGCWAEPRQGEREREREDTTSQSGVSSCLRRQWSLPVQTRPPAFYDLRVYCCLEELLLNFTPVCFSKTLKRFSKVYPREQLWESFEVIRQVIRGR